MIRSTNVLIQSSPWVGLALVAALACSVESKDDFEFDDTPEAGAGGSGATGGKGGAAGKGGSSGGKAGSTTGGKGGSSGGKGGSAGKGGAGGTGGNEGGEGGMIEGGSGGSSGTAGGGGTAGTAGDPCDPNPCVNGTCDADGSDYTCDCIDGYTGNRCQTNIDDCAAMPCLNGGMCLDRVASYECDCSGTGYTGDTCETQIQNCAQSPCDNGGVCTDVGSSRTCDCTGTGAMGESCEVEIDECQPRPCAHGICTDGRNSYTCDCNDTGYQGTNCDQDINECSSNNGGCDPLTTCVNTDGSHTCGDCPSGYSGNGTTGCMDINECASGNGGCDALTACTNTNGGRTCGPCPSGYTGTGATGCADINECASNNGGCDPLTTCTNTAGSRSCGACPAGYTGTGATGCVNINECAGNPCRNGGTCVDGVNMYTCNCVAPWTGSICGNATLTVAHTDRGWYSSTGEHPSANLNTLTGLCYDCGSGESRSFFVFDVPNFTGTVSAVTLQLEHEAFTSLHTTETIQVWDVTTAVSTLVAGGTGLVSIFNDLGSGTSFGTHALSASTVNTIRNIPLASAVNVLVQNARGARFAVGVRESTLSTQTAAHEFVRFSASSEARSHNIVVTVIP